jgi:MFS family permease
MVQIQAIGIFAGSYLYGWLVDMTMGWKVIGFLGIFISILGIISGLISSRLILGNKHLEVARD